jgi:hypothetical protein
MLNVLNIFIVWGTFNVRLHPVAAISLLHSCLHVGIVIVLTSVITVLFVMFVAVLGMKLRIL